MKIIKYLCLSLILVGAGSCSEDFLEKKPLGVLSSATLEDDENIDLALNRVYGTLSWREFYIGDYYFGAHELRADDFAPNGRYIDMNEYTFTAAAGKSVWDRDYQSILYCNVVLDRTPKMENREKAESLEGQARFFRAYYHFDLTNIFGDCVIRDHVPTSLEYDIPKSPKEEVIKIVKSDLEFAIAHLPTRQEWGDSQKGRITKGTAQGWLAKVYLYEKNYAKAAEYAQAVIDGGEYSLSPSYRELFSPANLYSSENMMPGHYIHSSTIADGRKWNALLQRQGLPSFGGLSWVLPGDNLAASYESADPRKSATLFTHSDYIEGYNNNQPIANWGIDMSKFKYANKKVIWPTSFWNLGNYSWMAINQMFLRYSDIILIASESYNELNNQAKALMYLEQIRFRARGNKTFQQSITDGENQGAGILPQIVTTDKAQLRLAIWHERRVELALEGQRWFDLVRYNKVADYNGNDGTGYTETYLRDVLGRKNFNYNKHSILAIPDVYVTSSQGILKQDPNW